ncbi:MAG: hypothetical protein JST70_01800 [Bacteroidetes bacterium]|nr:hypothetical protein [Bacteroidota bacterium]
MPILQTPSGTRAEDILRQVNQAGNRPPNGGDQATTQKWVMEQLNNDPAYNPGLRNPIRTNVPQSQQDYIMRLLAESKATEDPKANVNKLTNGYYKSPEFAEQTQAYTDALQHLEDMLGGKLKLCVADAYYLVENAYGNAYLSEKEYRENIMKSSAFIKEWMKQNGMDAHNNDDVHLAIQKFMSEKLTITKSSTGREYGATVKLVSHLPFYYDFEDNGGEKDHKNFFLTKCLATGSGQCSSLPAVYLTLAEALGVKAYLSVAPQHSFVKYQDNNGNILNYEPTSNWKMSDKWYQDNMHITPQAIRNHIYLDTLNSRQIIADCMIYMAWGYMKKHGSADGSFVSRCLDQASKEFPYENLYVHFVHSSMLCRMLNTICYYEGLQSMDDVRRSKQASELYSELEKNEDLIKRQGYTPMPAELYDLLLKEHEFKGRLQDSLHINRKVKRNLFTEIN